MPRIPVNGVTLNVEVAGDGTPLALLHGFTGRAESWGPHIPAFATRCRTVAIDLLGHGRSDAPADPDRYRIEHAAQDILAVLDALRIARAAILGYSMGGRLGLFLATVAPERITALIVESASAGIRDAALRGERMARDTALADEIERDGVAAFVDRWERLPLFATQRRLPPAARDALRAHRLAHSARGLANSLRGMGQGAQPSLWDRLPSLSVPTLLLVGALDAAYVAHGREMSRLIPAARLVAVPDAGHTVHLEQPEIFKRTVLEFLAAAGTDHAGTDHAGEVPSNAPGHSGTGEECSAYKVG